MLNKRSFQEIFWGVINRILHLIAYITFPSHLTTWLHRLRGVKIGERSKISRSVHIDDSYPHLVEIGNDVWVTAGVEILCHERDLSYYKIGQPVKDCPLKKDKVIIIEDRISGISIFINLLFSNRNINQSQKVEVSYLPSQFLLLVLVFS